ncbi:hypothetical protein [Rahnella aquatilis]|uniref:hypothetical protein n=1 Tax=Rahnella aquatilis TaxID=34038 RepID=UPI000648362D|nr:hypothetical protein [Rahnella aquatilis]
MESTDFGSKYKELVNNISEAINNYVIVYSYCDSIIAQRIITTNMPEILGVVSKFNHSLVEIQKAAIEFRVKANKNMSETIQDLLTFLYLHIDISSSLSSYQTAEEINSMLILMANNAALYNSKMDVINEEIINFSAAVLKEMSVISTSISEMNALISGDSKVLEEITQQISKIQSELNDAIKKNKISVGSTVGSLFLIIFGAVTFYAGGGILIAGGISALTASIVGDITLSEKIKHLQDQKSSLLEEKNTLSEEVLIATGIQTTLNPMLTLSKNTQGSCNFIASSWILLAAEFSQWSEDIICASKSIEVAQEMYLLSADTIIEYCITDAIAIQSMLLGTTTIQASTPKDDLWEVIPMMLSHLFQDQYVMVKN